MDKEYISPHQMGNYPKLFFTIALGFFLLVGIGVGVLGFYTAFFTEGDSITLKIQLLILSMSVAVIVCGFGWATFSSASARYTFTDQGLLVKYPAKKEELISWDAFQQVCVCYAAYTQSGTRACTVICCVKKGERKNGIGRWKTDNPFRYRTVIRIEYKESLLNGLKDKYPGTVEDLRNTPQYRLLK